MKAIDVCAHGARVYWQCPQLVTSVEIYVRTEIKICKTRVLRVARWRRRKRIADVLGVPSFRKTISPKRACSCRSAYTVRTLRNESFWSGTQCCAHRTRVYDAPSLVDGHGPTVSSLTVTSLNVCYFNYLTMSFFGNLNAAQTSSETGVAKTKISTLERPGMGWGGEETKTGH